jgi:predicted Zn finger-like uncharacterized protein
MLIVCPNCATSYQVEPPSLGPGGRSVRCARCQNQWFATAPTVVPALASVDDLDVVDNGPRIPSFDALPPPVETEPAPEWGEPESAEENPGVVAEEASAALMIAEDLGPEAASTDGIDLRGLSAEIEVEREEQTAAADQVLAEITGDDAPSLVPSQGPDSAATVSALGAGEDIESVAARRARREALYRGRWAVPGLPAIILALVAVNAALIGWRSDMVRLLPQTASLYAAIGMPVNLRGLAFENIKIGKDVHDGVAVLVVEGSIVNVTARPAEVPRLRMSVRNESKNEIYTWTTLPTRSILGPGETLPFRSRLASPPAEARDVLLRFFNRRDMVAGLL